MPRAAIYARFSTDLQRDRSIEDQAALCRQYAEGASHQVVAEFEDRARSGSSVLGRDGLMALMDAARGGRFDLVIVEALDRLSRDQEDLAGIWKRLSFLGVEIMAVHDGRADQVQVGIRGLVGALYLQDLAHKVRRGMAGVVRDGRSPGGRAYGYRPVPGQPGEIEIVEAEAAVVRRIFALYVAGDHSLRDIAGLLNREGVPPPRGRCWMASTLNGNQKRGYGILHNEIYAGTMVWNRVRMVRDPDTGRRVGRENPRDQWQRVDVPHLAIIDPATWTAAQRHRHARAESPRRRQRVRARRLLSGLLKCGACGGGMSIKDRSGRPGAKKRIRIQCTQAKEARSCANGRAYYLDGIEAAVVEGLRQRMGDRKAIALYVGSYNDEMVRLTRALAKNYGRLEANLATAQRRLDRAIDALINEELEGEEAAARVAALRAERNALRRQLEMAEAPPKVVSLHPAAVADYLAAIDRLDAALQADADAGAPEAMAAVRALVEAVVVHPPAEPGGRIEIDVRGHLASLIGREVFPQARVLGGAMVAEVRFGHAPQPGIPQFSWRVVAA